jgi:hypothetical protein
MHWNLKRAKMFTRKFWLELGIGIDQKLTLMILVGPWNWGWHGEFEVWTIEGWTEQVILNSIHYIPCHSSMFHHPITSSSNDPICQRAFHDDISSLQGHNARRTNTPGFSFSTFSNSYSHNTTRLALPHLGHLGFKFTNSFCFNLMHYHERRRVLFIFVFPTNFLISYLL